MRLCKKTDSREGADDMRMKLRYSKLMLAISVAVLTVTSFLTIAGSSASDVNEITLRCGKDSFSCGERINVSVGFVPDRDGAAGFAVNLHYDPEKVTVHIPDDREAADTYNVNSKFSVITNYSYSSGIVRIVGANLDSTNVSTQTLLSLASFDVKDNVQGDIRFYSEVETLVRSAEGDFVNAPYSAPELSVRVNAPTAAAAPKPVTAAVTTAPKPVTASVSEPASATTTVTTTVTTAAPPAEITAAEAAPQTVSETAAADIGTAKAAANAVSEPVSVKDDPEDGALFAYFREGSDFNSQESVYYRIPIRKYITDKSKHYDVKIAVQSSGNANGGLSVISDGEYRKQDSKLRTRAEEIWTLEDIDPMAVTSDIYVTLYYLKANSEFKVNSVEFTERAELPKQDAPAMVSAEEPADAPEQPAPVNEQSEPVQNSASEPAGSQPATKADIPEDTNTDTNTDADIAENTFADNSMPLQDAVPDGGNGQNAETDQPSYINTGANGAEPRTDIGEDLSYDSAVPANSANESRAVSPEAEKIEDTVNRASKAAGSPDSSNKNPDTGSEDNFWVRVVMMLSGLYILWSLFTVLFNRIHEDG